MHTLHHLTNFFILSLATISIANAEVTHIFEAGKKASAQQVNENFGDIDNRVTEILKSVTDIKNGITPSVEVDCSADPLALQKSLDSGGRDISIIAGVCNGSLTLESGLFSITNSGTGSVSTVGIGDPLNILRGSSLKLIGLHITGAITVARNSTLELTGSDIDCAGNFSGIQVDASHLKMEGSSIRNCGALALSNNASARLLGSNTLEGENGAAIALRSSSSLIAEGSDITILKTQTSADKEVTVSIYSSSASFNGARIQGEIYADYSSVSLSNVTMESDSASNAAVVNAVHGSHIAINDVNLSGADVNIYRGSTAAIAGMNSRVLTGVNLTVNRSSAVITGSWQGTLDTTVSNNSWLRLTTQEASTISANISASRFSFVDIDGNHTITDTSTLTCLTGSEISKPANLLC